MKLNSPNPSWLTQLTCSLNPNQVLKTAHLIGTAPGPTPQSRLQNTRGKFSPSPLSQNDSQSENEVEDPRPIETATTNMRSGSPQVLKTSHRHRTNPSPTLRPRLQNTSQGTPWPTSNASQSSQQ